MHSVFCSGPDGRLAADGVCLERALVAAGASTPAYVYSVRAVVEQFCALQGALAGTDHLIAVALKANALPALLIPLRDLGAGGGFGGGIAGGERTRFPRTSDGHVRCRQVRGGPRDRAGPRGAFCFGRIGSGALLNRLALRRGLRSPALLRLNPGVDVATHPKIATGTPAAKFGMAVADLLDVAERARDWHGVEILGVHAHAGFQVREVATLARSAERLGKVFARLRRSGIPVRILDVGGGLGIPHRDGEDEIPLAVYAEAVLRTLQDVPASEFPDADPALVFEPGRALFGPAGALVVRVLHTKQTGTREFCVVDGGMNDFLRPALYGAWHRVVPLTPRPGLQRVFDVVGGVCESGDLFGEDRALPPPEPGDLLAVLDAGAYGYSMASNYNLRPRPAEVVIQDGSAFLARPAEKPAELAAHELGAQLAGIPG